MKTITITGASGFIGSHVVEACVEQGYKVRAFVRYNSRNSWGWLEESRSLRDIEVIAGDIRDYDSVLNAVKGSDAVFHLAALIAIPYSYVSPLAYVKTNVEGTYNVLQASKETGLSSVIITSTSETYGTAQYVPIDEKHPAVGQSPYAASKIAADQLAQSYYRSFGLPVKVVRPFNTYGPRQSARAIVPTVITQILAGKRKIKLGNVLPTRDLTFVKDTAQGFLRVFDAKGLNGEAVNIGMAMEISVEDLVHKIARILKVKVSIISDDARVRRKESEVERLCCDNTNILAHTKWRPSYDLDQGLKETIGWIKSNMRHYKADIYNI